VLIPDPARLDVDSLWQAAQQAVLALKRLVGDPPRFFDGYGRLNINARTRAAIIRDMVAPIEQALEPWMPTTCQLLHSRRSSPPLASTSFVRHAQHRPPGSGKMAEGRQQPA
jgi:hypothetical protein